MVTDDARSSGRIAVAPLSPPTDSFGWNGGRGVDNLPTEAPFSYPIFCFFFKKNNFVFENPLLVVFRLTCQKLHHGSISEMGKKTSFFLPSRIYSGTSESPPYKTCQHFFWGLWYFGPNLEKPVPGHPPRHPRGWPFAKKKPNGKPQTFSPWSIGKPSIKAWRGWTILLGYAARFMFCNGPYALQQSSAFPTVPRRLAPQGIAWLSEPKRWGKLKAASVKCSRPGGIIKREGECFFFLMVISYVGRFHASDS